ncbi:WbqC family protein [Lewinella sp. W8]|uniref:WbqC family protein n=1 Tax=Lewinella sp. W8 TaxID=2528208 RepID=UPI001068C15C|nr:WbqC family protein [Lewinella sp. W8]MTB50287.1 hypothetical protein [Lewinella sp. W8]
MSNSLHTTTAYFPPFSWFLLGASAGAWTWEAQENYQKGGLRNRCHIAGPNGRMPLSVPLEKGKHQKMPIREVRISYRRDWWREHEQSIRTAYGRAPYFEYYAEEVFAAARQRPPTLWALNESLTATVCRLLQWPVVPEPSEAFSLTLLRESAQRLREFQPPEYPQVFTERHGFLGGLSVLDALFCLGPMAATI